MWDVSLTTRELQSPRTAEYLRRSARGVSGLLCDNPGGQTPVTGIAGRTFLVSSAGDPRPVSRIIAAWASAAALASQAPTTATASRPASHDADQTPLRTERDGDLEPREDGEIKEYCPTLGIPVQLPLGTVASGLAASIVGFCYGVPIATTATVLDCSDYSKDQRADLLAEYSPLADIHRI